MFSARYAVLDYDPAPDRIGIPGRNPHTGKPQTYYVWGNRQSHCETRAMFLLPCDQWCPRETVRPERGGSLIDRVKAAYRIEDVADRLTQMRWNGDRGMGRCPFHADRSPSFSVDTGKQKWKCFAACGHGDVIDLIRMAKERGLAYG